MYSKKKPINPKNVRHGHIFSPASRVFFAWQDGKIDKGALNQVEAGKFFPALQGNLKDAIFSSDVPSATPPQDGQIASGGQPTTRILDEPGTHWRKHKVGSGDMMTVSWDYTQAHTTRRWNYFITKPDWNPDQVLSRSQFEEKPFYQVQLNYEPFWSHSSELKPPIPTIHELPLPQRIGYHVLLAVWEIADTGNAFYQVIDLDFIIGDGNERPERPTALKVLDIKEKSVKLGWTPPNNIRSIEKYRLYRNGITSIDMSISTQSMEDQGLTPNTEYFYQITTINDSGNESLPSNTIKVTTLSEGGSDATPSAPTHLHLMGVSDSHVNLMWGRSLGNNPVKSYRIFRDGREIMEINSDRESYSDKNVQSNTQYRYFVMAIDSQGLWSVPSNILTVQTKDSAETPNNEWKIDMDYKVNEKVTFQNNLYRCLQAHRSNIGWNPWDTINVLWVISQ